MRTHVHILEHGNDGRTLARRNSHLTLPHSIALTLMCRVQELVERQRRIQLAFGMKMRALEEAAWTEGLQGYSDHRHDCDCLVSEHTDGHTKILTKGRDV